MVGVQEHGSRPGLLCIAHWLAAIAMQPFVKLPLAIQPLPVRQRQTFEQLFGCSSPTLTHQGRNMKAADHGPDAAVMVLMRQVERPATVVVAPITFTWVDRWIDRFRREW